MSNKAMTSNELRQEVANARAGFLASDDSALVAAKVATQASVVAAVRKGHESFALAYPSGLHQRGVALWREWLQAAGIEVEIGQPDRPGDAPYFVARVR